LIAFAVWGIFDAFFFLSVSYVENYTKGTYSFRPDHRRDGHLDPYFQNAILVSSDMVGWVLMALGIIMTFLGLYHGQINGKKRKKKHAIKKPKNSLQKNSPPQRTLQSRIR
jgi:hypothetical protein